MHVREFIFSNKSSVRIFRHSLFWVTSFLYLLLFQYHGGIEGWPLSRSILLKASESLLVFVVVVPIVYFFLYYSIPRYYIRKKTGAFVLSSLLALLITEAYFYLIHFVNLNVIHAAFFDHTTNISHEDYIKIFLSPVIHRVIPLSALAITIKYMASSWQKQREIEKLENEKLYSELKLVKTQISSEFIFTSLRQIIDLSRRSSAEAPKLVLYLSNLLRYLLYESDVKKVPLKKEIEVMRTYLSLCNANDQLKIDISFQVKGNTDPYYITPLILLPFLEGAFRLCHKSDSDKKWITADLKLSGDQLHFKIIYSNPDDARADSLESDPQFQSIIKRLEIDYPGAYDLKRITANEMGMISLNISIPGTENKTPVKKVA